MQMHFWKFPWSYKQSFTVSIIIFLIGILIETINKGNGISPPPFPINLFLGGLILLIILLLYVSKENNFVKWLSSIPAAISVISVYTGIILIMGFIPQINNQNKFLEITGFSHIASSWEFLLCSLQLIITLGLVTIKRLSPFTFKNFSFFLNHAGLWIILVSGSLGVSDMQRVYIPAYYNVKTNTGNNTKTDETVKLPFSIELIKFKIEDYNPEIVLINTNNKETITENNITKNIIQGTLINISNFKIKVDTFYNSAFHNQNSYTPMDIEGSSPAAFITVYNNMTNDTISGWISSQNLQFPAKYLKLNDSLSAYFTIPQPKRFSSILKITNENNIEKTILIEVNKPYKVGQWELYQTSYELEKGNWSTYSGIEAVKDNWLYAVYTGVFMIMAGAILLFWQVKRK